MKTTYAVQLYVTIRTTARGKSRGAARQVAIARAMLKYDVLRDAVDAVVLNEYDDTEECSCATT